MITTRLWGGFRAPPPLGKRHVAPPPHVRPAQPPPARAGGGGGSDPLRRCLSPRPELRLRLRSAGLHLDLGRRRREHVLGPRRQLERQPPPGRVGCRLHRSGRQGRAPLAVGDRRSAPLGVSAEGRRRRHHAHRRRRGELDHQHSHGVRRRPPGRRRRPRCRPDRPDRRRVLGPRPAHHGRPRLERRSAERVGHHRSRSRRARPVPRRRLAFARGNAEPPHRGRSHRGLDIRGLSARRRAPRQLRALRDPRRPGPRRLLRLRGRDQRARRHDPPQQRERRGGLRVRGREPRGVRRGDRAPDDAGGEPARR